MSKMIQIRNVSDDVHRTLKARAAAAGMSLSDYLKQELERLAAQRSWEEVEARIQARGRANIPTEEIVAAIRESRGD